MAEHIEQRRIWLAGHAALPAVHGQPELGLHQNFLLYTGLARTQSRSFVLVGFSAIDIGQACRPEYEAGRAGVLRAAGD
jgi:hypothetical protein